MDTFHVLSARVWPPPSPPMLEVYENNTAIKYQFYKHFKFKHVRMVRTPLLRVLPIIKKAQTMWIKWRSHEKLHVNDRYELFSRSLWVSRLYILCPRFNIIQRYITADHMLTLSRIFFGLISSMFISDVYGLTRLILFLIFIGPYCIATVPLVHHSVTKNGQLHGVSYLYAAILLSMTLSLTLYSWSTRFLFLRILYLFIFICFFSRIYSKSNICFIRRIISWTNTNGPGL